MKALVYMIRTPAAPSGWRFATWVGSNMNQIIINADIGVATISRHIYGHLGSGPVQEMQQWVEYLTFDGISPMADLRRSNGRAEPWRIMFWGVGNENWGCGGTMRAEHYADEYRRYQTYVRNFGNNQV